MGMGMMNPDMMGMMPQHDLAMGFDMSAGTFADIEACAFHATAVAFLFPSLYLIARATQLQAVVDSAIIIVCGSGNCLWVWQSLCFSSHRWLA